MPSRADGAGADAVYSCRAAGGLLVYGCRMPFANTAAAALVVGTGSADDGHAPGAAHLLEHLLWTHAIGSWTERGVRASAATTPDHTSYYAWCLPEDLGAVTRAFVALIGDGRPDLSRLAAERVAVITEAARGSDRPDELAMRRMQALAFRGGPLAPGRPVTAETIAGVDAGALEDLRARGYVAGNSALVVTGRFEWPELLGRIDDLPRRAGSALERPAPSRATRPAEIDVTRDGRLAVEHISFGLGAPSRSEPRAPAAAVLAAALGRGASSLAVRWLAQRGIPASAAARYEHFASDGLIQLDLAVDPSHAPAAVAVLLDRLAGVGRDGILAEPLARARESAVQRVRQICDSPASRLGPLIDDALCARSPREQAEIEGTLRAVRAPHIVEALAPLAVTLAAVGPVDRTVLLSA